jgi:hypothetical protein
MEKMLNYDVPVPPLLLIGMMGDDSLYHQRSGGE